MGEEVDLPRWLRAQAAIARNSPSVTYVGDMMAAAFFERCASELESLRASLTRVEEERAQRANSQTHAEALLDKLSAFLTGWSFGDLDAECGAEADALDGEISALFAYGWPQAQHATRLSRASATETERSE